MWLKYGWDERWADAFISEADYADAWRLHRDSLLQGHAPGRRPIGWWVNEGPCRYPGYDEERQFMYTHDLLEPAERAALLADWREAFERGWRWADVPPKLWAEWEAQRRTKEAAEPPPAA
jgi:hypothetical protein